MNTTKERPEGSNEQEKIKITILRPTPSPEELRKQQILKNFYDKYAIDIKYEDISPNEQTQKVQEEGTDEQEVPKKNTLKNIYWSIGLALASILGGGVLYNSCSDKKISRDTILETGPLPPYMKTSNSNIFGRLTGYTHDSLLDPKTRMLKINHNSVLDNMYSQKLAFLQVKKDSSNLADWQVQADKVKQLNVNEVKSMKIFDWLNYVDRRIQKTRDTIDWEKYNTIALNDDELQIALSEQVKAKISSDAFLLIMFNELLPADTTNNRDVMTMLLDQYGKEYVENIAAQADNQLSFGPFQLHQTIWLDSNGKLNPGSISKYNNYIKQDTKNKKYQKFPTNMREVEGDDHYDIVALLAYHNLMRMVNTEKDINRDILQFLLQDDNQISFDQFIVLFHNQSNGYFTVLQEWYKDCQLKLSQNQPIMQLAQFAVSRFDKQSQKKDNKFAQEDLNKKQYAEKVLNNSTLIDFKYFY